MARAALAVRAPVRRPSACLKKLLTERFACVGAPCRAVARLDHVRVVRRIVVARRRRRSRGASLPCDPRWPAVARPLPVRAAAPCPAAAVALLALLLRRPVPSRACRRPSSTAATSSGVEFQRLPALHARRHRDRAVARADQAADREAERLEQAPHLAVAAFLQHDVIPVVALPSPPPSSTFSHLRRTVLELDAGRAAPAAARRVERAHHAHRVFALDLVARMHHPVGELARVREQQQALGVEVEAADRDPLAVADVRQLLEHRRAALRDRRA